MPFLGVLTYSSRSGLRPIWSCIPLQLRVVTGSDGTVAKGILEMGVALDFKNNKPNALLEFQDGWERAKRFTKTPFRFEDVPGLPLLTW